MEFTARALWALVALGFARLCEGATTPLSDANIQNAVALWISNQSSAEATYGNIEDWDTSPITDMSDLFKNRDSFNADISSWDVGTVTSMARVWQMFHNARAFNIDLGGWNVARVTNMSYLFYYAQDFNSDLGFWNVSKVTNMQYLFYNAVSFNSDLIFWNVGKVTNMRYLFANANNFNPAYLYKYGLSSWNVGMVTDMESLFYSAEKFDSDLSSWNVGKVTNMQYLFYEAANFNSDLSLWNVGKVTDMQSLFRGADNFNSDLSLWNVGKVTNMEYLFRSADNFNSDLSFWNVGKVTNMYSLFRDVENFNSALSNWDVSDVTTMGFLFGTARNFNSDLSLWNVGKVTNMQSLFYETDNFNSDLSLWNVGKVTSMAYLFANANNFNSELSLWNVGMVTDMESLFYFAEKFDSDLSLWNVGKVTSMARLFQSAINYNSDLSLWNVGKVTNMAWMFYEAANFNSDLSLWNVGKVTEMQELFESADNFNSELSFWNVGMVTTMKQMFNNAESFEITLCGNSWINSNFWINSNGVEKSEMFSNSGGSIGAGCGDVDPGSYCSGSSGTCQIATCRAGRFCAGGPSNVGESCPAGKYNDVTGATSAEDCVGVCPAGSYCPPGTSNSTQYLCPAGKYGADTGATSAEDCVGVCPKAGKYSPVVGITNVSDCGNIDCPAGRYGTVSGGAARVEDCAGSCLAGKYSEVTGITSANDCDDTDCPAGSYCPSGTTSLTLKPCPTGKYSTRIGVARVEDCEELPCKKGYWCPPGTADPYSNPCPLGKRPTGRVNNTQEQTACELCPPNTYGVANENGSASEGNPNKCADCPSGKASASGSTQCYFFCDTGQYYDASTSNEDERCIDCPVGRYSTTLGITASGECSECEAGFKCSGGFARAYCPAGTRSTERGDACVQCDANTFSLGGVARCSVCATGSSAPGSSYCEDCKAGTFLNTSKTPSTCDPCAAGSISKTGADSCTPCGAGTWQNGTDCVACPAGYFGNRTGLSNEICDGACPPGTHSYRYATKCQDCEAGKHAPNASMEDCVACNDVKALTPSEDATTCLCEKGTYRDLTGECVRCVEGMECSEAGVGIATAKLQKDNWRPSTDSAEIEPCPFEDSCQGGVNSSCLPGNEGVLCAVCSDSYYRPSALTSCAVCNNNTTEAVMSALAIVAAMIVGLFVLVAINRRAPTGMLRPIIDVVQRFSVMMLFNSSFPKELVSLGRVLGALSFSLDVVAPECAGFGANFYGKFAATVGLLASLFGAMLVPLLRTKVANGWTVDETLESEAAGIVFRDIFVIVLMVHPSVSGKAMQFFRCRRIDGTSYLMADYSLECFDSTWWTYLPFVVFVFLTFSLGVPFAIFYVLRKRAADLYDAQGKPAVPSLDVLYAVYREGAYWYESVQMLFKVALWGTLVFFEFKSEMQLATALVVNVLQLCVYIKIEPMGGPNAALINIMQAAGLVLTTYINFGGFAINYLTVARENAQFRDQPDDSYEEKITIINTIMVFLTFSLMAPIVSVALKNAYDILRNASIDDVRNSIAEKRASLATSFSRALRCVRCSGGDEDAVAVVGNPITQGGQQESAAVNIQMVAQEKLPSPSP